MTRYDPELAFAQATFEVDQSADSLGGIISSAHSTGLTFNRHSGVTMGAYAACENQSQPS